MPWFYQIILVTLTGWWDGLFARELEYLELVIVLNRVGKKKANMRALIAGNLEKTITICLLFKFNQSINQSINQ